MFVGWEQEVGAGVFLRYVRNEQESTDRELKGAPVGAGRGEG